MPNFLAYLVLWCWPFVVVALFRKLPPAQALIWSVLAGYLILPTVVSIDIPGLPLIDKTLLPTVAAFVMCYVASRQQKTGLFQAAPSAAVLAAKPPEQGRRIVMPKMLAGTRLLWVLIAVLLVTPLITVLNNGEPLVYGPLVIPGLRLYDAFGTILELGISIVPFLLARRFLNTPESHIAILWAFCLGGLAYSVLMLVEIRLSPQLNVWLYGFFPHSFGQHIRGGSYRPIVFLQHGLWVGIFVAMSVVSAVILWRNDVAEGNRKSLSIFIVLWMILILYLARSLGALLIAVVLLAVFTFASRRVHMGVAISIAAFVLIYPVLRSSGVIPADTLVDLARMISDDRAGSLQYRFTNEDVLLERASEKSLTGWGSWGRPMIYDSDGQMTSTTDGSWIILIGTFGWIGYIAHFGLLTLPLVLIARQRRHLDLTLVSSGLALVLCVNLLDLLPNATLTPLTYLLAGALMGRYEYGRDPQAAPVKQMPPAAARLAEAGIGGQMARISDPQVRHQRKARTEGTPSRSLP